MRNTLSVALVYHHRKLENYLLILGVSLVASVILDVVLVVAKVFRILIMLLLLSTFGRCCTLVVITDTTLPLAGAKMEDRICAHKRI